ncbi:MAG: retropepsin-like domain-containing protein [Defluviitaleaceae bacterium]|nr:retropepsin-like domain-containing protein [Defluviitaleaceae bacterium]
MTSDRKSFKAVDFKLDSGSDFTTLSGEDLQNLGFARDFLRSCPLYSFRVSTASKEIRLRYMDNISIKFGEREIQNCRIFFTLDAPLRSLFGSDILKYFNWSVNYDTRLFRLDKAKSAPLLSPGEEALQIYSVETK